MKPQQRATVWDKPNGQVGMFEELEHDWRDEWTGMPEYDHEQLAPWHTVYVHVVDAAGLQAFADLVEQTVNPTTKSIWYPPQGDRADLMRLRYVDES